MGRNDDVQKVPKGGSFGEQCVWGGAHLKLPLWSRQSWHELTSAPTYGRCTLVHTYIHTYVRITSYNISQQQKRFINTSGMAREADFWAYKGHSNSSDLYNGGRTFWSLIIVIMETVYHMHCVVNNPHHQFLLIKQLGVFRNCEGLPQVVTVGIMWLYSIYHVLCLHQLHS